MNENIVNIIVAIPPVANAGADNIVDPSEMVTLYGSSSYDPDGNIIAYEWTQISGTPVSLDNEESLITSFIAI